MVLKPFFSLKPLFLAAEGGGLGVFDGQNRD
ncbi:MAG: hypothetical protein ACI9XO_004696 [Paraglaciecola sp.]|jgi:hypothetical protein